MMVHVHVGDGEGEDAVEDGLPLKLTDRQRRSADRKDVSLTLFVDKARTHPVVFNIQNALQPVVEMCRLVLPRS